MLDNELPPKEGLPPRERNADVPEHAGADAPIVWIGGAIAIAAVLALVTFGGTGSSNLNTEPGMTTGAAPSAAQKGTQ